MSSPLRDRLNRGWGSSAIHQPGQVIETEIWESHILDQEVHPWRRLAARLADHVIYGLLGLPVLGPAIWLAAIFQNGGDLPMALACLLAASFLASTLTLCLEAFLTSYWGSTIGKHLFNLQVTDANGARLDFLTSFRRAVSVSFFAFATAISSLALLAGVGLGIWQFRMLKIKGYTLWDAANHTRVGNPPIRKL